MKNANKCPKCGSVAVAGPHPVTGQIPIKVMIGFRSATIQSYTCLSCGYTELFPDEKGLENIRNHYKMK